MGYKTQININPRKQQIGNCHLVRPFNFQSKDQYNQTRQKTYFDQWRGLQKQCNNLGILPPTLSSNFSSKPKKLNKTKIVLNKRKRKNERKSR